MKNLSVITIALLMASTLPVYAVVNKDKVASYVQDAEKYIKKGDLNAAIIQLKNAIIEDPKNAENRVALADLYLKVMNAPSAEKEYMRAKELGINESNIIINLSKTRLMMRQYQTVLDSLDIKNVKDDEIGDYYLIIGNAYQGLNELDKALEFYEKGEKTKGKNDQLSIAIAQIYYFKKDLVGAENKIDEALEYNPKNVRGIILKGELVNLKEGPTKSISYFEQALEYEPNNISALFKVAGILFDLKRSDEALEKLDVIYSIVPKHPLANYLSAVIYSQRNELDKAEEFLDASGPALDDFPNAIMLRGVISYAKKNYAQAIYNLTKLLKITPNNIVARRVLAASLLRQNDPQEAINTLLPVVKQGKAGSVVYAILGSAEMKLGNYEEGTAYFEKAVESNPNEVQFQAQLALSMLVSGDSKAAQENLHEMLEKNPDSKQASVLLALISLRERNFEKALENADIIINQDKANPTGYNFKGEAYLGLGKMKEAREQFSKSLEVSPSYNIAKMNMALLEMKEGNEEQAMKIYNEILKEDKDHTGALIALARYNVEKKDFTEAESYYQAAAKGAPKNIQVRIELAEFFVSQKRYDHAKAVAQQITLIDPNDARGYQAIGNIEIIRGDIPAAIGNFERMAVILGNNPGAYQLLGRAQLRGHDVSAARKSFLKAMSFANKKATLLIDLYGLETEQKNYVEAKTYIDQLKEIDGKNPVPYILQGRLFSIQNKNADSLASYQKASDLGAKGSMFVREISVSYLSNGQSDKALDIMQTWLDGNKGDIDVRLTLAGHYLSEKDYQKSIAQYEEILKQQANNPIALNNVSWLYSQVGQNKKALVTAEKAYNIAPEEPSFMDTYAWILVQQGQNDKGLDLLQKATTKDPSMMEIRYHYAVALKNGGRNSVAKKELETIISSGASFSGMEDARKLLSELSK